MRKLVIATAIACSLSPTAMAQQVYPIPHDSAVATVVAARVAREVCPVSKDRLLELTKWIDGITAEENVNTGYINIWLGDHPAERNFLFDARNGDRNARKIMCDILDWALDGDNAGNLLPWSEGYFKRSGVKCASGYHHAINKADIFCEIGDGRYDHDHLFPDSGMMCASGYRSDSDLYCVSPLARDGN
jgi:hypothetical protein